MAIKARLIVCEEIKEWLQLHFSALIRTWAESLSYTSRWARLEEHLMKAIVRTKYGPPDALQFTEVEKPAPKDNEVLIKLRAASVNPLDLFTMRGPPLIRLIPGLRTPRISD